jgi:thioredoxin-related protein
MEKKVMKHANTQRFFKQIVFTAIAVLSLASAVSADEIRWKDVTSGMQEGKQSHKYVLADIYTDWCGWCKRLDRDTFSNPDLARFLRDKFVPVKANAEDSAAGQKLAGEYGVNGYPCALVFNPDGKLIGRIVGYKDAQGYQTALQDIINHPNQ